MARAENQPLIEHKVDGKNDAHIHRLQTYQMFVRFVILFLFTLALDIGGSTEKQFIYSWVEKHPDEGTSGLNESSSGMPGNNTSTDPCGNNISANAEKKDQVAAVNWLWYFRLVEHGGAVPFTFIFGFYSDYFGRKFLMKISVVGNFLRYAIMSIVVYMDLDLNYLFIAFGCDAIVGCHYTFYIACMTSVADKTGRNTKRSFGMVLMEGIIGLGLGAGSISTGYMIHYLGFLWPIVLSSSLFVLVFLLVFLFETDTYGKRSTINLTVWKSIKTMFGIFFNKNDIRKGKLWKFNLSFLLFLISYFAYNGQAALETFFQLRSPFCWTSEQIGYYGLAATLCQYVIAVLIFTGLQRCHCRDEIIVIMSFLSFAGNLVFFGFATASWMIYASMGVGILKIMCFATLKSVTSKLLTETKQGVMFAGIYTIENLTSAFAGTVVNNIYSLTQDYMAGFVFLVLAGLVVIAILLLIPLAVSQWNERWDDMKTLDVNN